MINNLERSMEEWAQEAKKKGIKEGEKRGIEEGEIRKAKIIVRQMLRKGMDETLIEELTGLTQDEIKKIKEEKE